MVLLLLILALEVALAFGIAEFLRSRTRWSSSKVALTAAVPVPLLLVALAAYLAGYERLFRSVDEQQADLAITIGIGALGLYLIGFVVAIATARRGKQPPLSPKDVRDVFK